MFVVEAANFKAITPGNLLCKYTDDTYIIIPLSSNILIHELNSTTLHLIVPKQSRPFPQTRRVSILLLHHHLSLVLQDAVHSKLSESQLLTACQWLKTFKALLHHVHRPFMHSEFCILMACPLSSSRSFLSSGNCQTLLCMLQPGTYNE